MPTVSPEFIKAREDFAAWYDNKPEDMQALIDEISDRTYSIIDEDEYDAFIQELDSLGITDASTFQDAFHGEYEGIGEDVLGTFSEQLYDDCGQLPNDDVVRNCIDWNQVWYYAMQYDFYPLEFMGNTYFFNRNY
jgi:hypothetical protein